MTKNGSNGSGGDRNLSGLIAAPFTPMLPDRSLNLDLIPDLAKWLSVNGVSGAFVCGTTGEGASLSTEERMRVAKCWAKTAAGKLKLIVHVGNDCIDESRRLAKHAEEVGADAIASMGPTFFRPKTVEELVEYCVPVAAAAPGLPFYFYHIPVLTGIHLPMVEFLRQGSKRIPNLAGIKFTDEDLMSFTQCLNFEDGRFNILFGRDEILLAALALGAGGAVGSTYNFMAPIYHSILESLAKGDLISARRWQTLSIQIIAVMARHGGLRAGKAMMGIIGLDCGPVRPPLRDMPVSELQTFKSELELAGFPGTLRRCTWNPGRGASKLSAAAK
jgi:N-acetylneuraminate lyase